jgi:hypothetical protein
VQAVLKRIPPEAKEAADLGTRWVFFVCMHAECVAGPCACARILWLLS